MLIIKIKAGLGNQMFQYAFGRALSLERNETLFLDSHYYNNQPIQDAKREFILDKFNIKADLLSRELHKKYNTGIKIFLRKIYRKIYKIDDYKYYPSLIKSKISYYDGYWINQRYFIKYQDIIRKELSLKNPYGDAAKKVHDEISSSIKESMIPVSIHIRRGDFVSSPQAAFNGLMGMPYYEKAYDLLVSKYSLKMIKLFIFSDDISWVKYNLKLSCPMFFVSNNNVRDYEEVILMSQCSHHIIANSTFSWWGAWLNPNKNKIVISPKQWLKDKTSEELDILPAEWVKI